MLPTSWMVPCMGDTAVCEWMNEWMNEWVIVRWLWLVALAFLWKRYINAVHLPFSMWCVGANTLWTIYWRDVHCVPTSPLGLFHSLTLFLRVCHCVWTAQMSLQTVGRLHFSLGLQFEIKCIWCENDGEIVVQHNMTVNVSQGYVCTSFQSQSSMAEYCRIIRNVFCAQMTLIIWFFFLWINNIQHEQRSLILKQMTLVIWFF